LPDHYILLLIAFGCLVLLTAWLPMLLSEAPLSLPIACVAIGAAASALPIGVSLPHPSTALPVIERLTELIVIIALMGAGLKIDRRITWRSWVITWRLLGIAMPVTILALTLLGQTVLGLGIATALLLAAALAPTDPVLASDVQVGPPKSGEEDETRFSLTSEAGLNDGLAFPFVMCAIAIVEAQRSGKGWFWSWFGVEVVWRLSAGVVIGVVIGYALGWLVFKLPNRAKLSKTGDGFVALGITVIVYGLAESAHGYGFVSVFVAALALRASERNHAYNETLHDFAEQLERLLMMVVLVMFGASLTNVLSSLTWPSVVYAMVAIFAVRPIVAWFSLAGANCPPTERMAISFFGIRGIGSIYYLAFAMKKEAFEQTNLIWSTVALIILISVVLHGVTVTPVMKLIDRRRDAGVTAAETEQLKRERHEA
jgi:NhaP-type Na+/H+ or K+/H+ antiporter